MWIAINGSIKLADIDVLAEMKFCGYDVIIHEDWDDVTNLCATEISSGMRFPLGWNPCGTVGEVKRRLQQIKDAYGEMRIQNIIESEAYALEKKIEEEEKAC